MNEKTCKTCKYYADKKCMYYVFNGIGGKGTYEKSENDGCVCYDRKKEGKR